MKIVQSHWSDTGCFWPHASPFHTFHALALAMRKAQMYGGWPSHDYVIWNDMRDGMWGHRHHRHTTTRHTFFFFHFYFYFQYYFYFYFYFHIYFYFSLSTALRERERMIAGRSSSLPAISICSKHIGIMTTLFSVRSSTATNSLCESDDSITAFVMSEEVSPPNNRGMNTEKGIMMHPWSSSCSAFGLHS